MTCDLLVLGAGPGGTRAAFEGAARGLKTVLVEACFPGGTCLNSGCIPTKFLIGGTASLDLFAAQKKYKCAEGELRFSLAALQDRKDKYVKASREALRKRLEEAGVSLIHGRAAFSGPDTVRLGGENEQELHFKTCIVATGSTPAFFPGLKPDGASIMGSSAMLNLKEAPESLIIIGGGAIGLEMGDIFHRFGSKITLVEALPRLAANEDEDVMELLKKHHQRSGWTIHTGRKVASLETRDGRSVLTFEDGETISADKSLVAVGRTPASAGLNCDAAGISLDKRGFIRVDEQLRAGKNIHAVGDVNGRVLLAHAADHQAHYAVAHAAGELREAYTDTVMPSCIYGHMEVMRAGPTARQLQAAGEEVYISRSELISNPICQSYGASQGFIKIAWVNGQMRSITAVGHGVSHLVTLGAVAVTQQWQKKDVRTVIFAHPTLDEALESAMFAKTVLME